MLSLSRLRVDVAGITVCRDLSLVLEPGQCWAMLGRNGVGKTTLLHTLAGLRRPQAGEIHLDGRPLAGLPPRQRARRLGVLLQDSEPAFPASVLEWALTGRHPFIGRWGVATAQDEALARQALAHMALDGQTAQPVTTLSGGERRRLDVATLLTQDPAVMLLDEPVNHLDLAHQVRLLRLLRQQTSRRGKAVVMVLHDINLARRFCDRVLLLFGDGEVAHGSATELLEPQTLSRLYHTPIRRADGLFMAE